MKISNIDVKGVICLLYYEIGHESPPVLVSETPTNTYVDIEIPIDSLMAGELLITRELQVIFNHMETDIFHPNCSRSKKESAWQCFNLPFFT